jgi:hypothetical protein
MEKHLGTRYELLAEGRDSRTFIDPQRAGAAFFAARRQECPQLIQHDVYSIDGGNPQARHTVIGMTGHDTAGVPMHTLRGMPVDVRQGYDEAAQRSPANAIAVVEEQPSPQQAPLSELDGAPRKPVTLALHEHFELHREGHSPQQFNNARQAGAAFYAAPLEQQPRLLHLQPDQQPREVAITASTVGVLTDLGVYQYPNKVVANDLPVDVEVRQGYFGAMEQSVTSGLAVTDWAAATNNDLGRIPRLDQRLYGDLQALAMSHRELALQAWSDFAPPDVRRPTFIDLSTGQIATLDKTIDLAAAKTVQQYVYGDVRVLVPPLDQEAARLTPAHASVLASPQQQPEVPPTPTMPQRKGQTVSEQQQPQPQQLTKADEPVQGVRVGDEPVERITFSKRMTPAGLRYDVRAFNKHHQLLAEHKSASLDDLAPKLGQQVVNVLMRRTGRTGTVVAAQLEAPGQDRPQPGAQQPEAQQESKRYIDRSGPLDRAPGSMSAQQSDLNGTVAKVGEELAKALASAQSVGYFKQPGDSGHYPIHLVGTNLETAPSGREYYTYQGMGVAHTREELEQAVGKEHAQRVLDDPSARGGWKNPPEQVRQMREAAQQAALPRAPAQEAPAVANSIEPITERVQQRAAPREAQQPAAGDPHVPAAAAAAASRDGPSWSVKAAVQRVAARLAGEQRPGQQATAQRQASAATPDARQAKEAKQRELMTALYERFDVRGNDFLFKGEAGRVAFTDHGKQISTNNDVPMVVRAMADLAQAKGWEGIRIKGTPEFMRSTWLEARLRGIDVQGYTPTAEDRKQLMQAQQQQAQTPQHDQGPRQTAAKQSERSNNTLEQSESAQQQGSTPPTAQQEAQAQQTQANTPDVKREQAMNAMRSYLDTLKLDAPTVAETLKEWGAHIDKAIAQGKAVPTVQVYDPAVARTAAPTQAVMPQTAAHERSAPGR